VASWSPVTKTITGDDVTIIAYQLIIEKDEPPHPHMIGKIGYISPKQKPRGGRAMRELQGTARLKIHDGKLEEFKRLAAECMESVRTRDSGTLQYDWFFNSDCSECVVYERYPDSEALLEHGANLGETMAALLQICSISGEICGTPSEELRKALEGQDVRIYSPYPSSNPNSTCLPSCVNTSR
jgi:quinol monooxygenase YgiN